MLCETKLDWSQPAVPLMIAHIHVCVMEIRKTATLLLICHSIWARILRKALEWLRTEARPIVGDDLFDLCASNMQYNSLSRATTWCLNISFDYVSSSRIYDYNQFFVRQVPIPFSSIQCGAQYYGAVPAWAPINWFIVSVCFARVHCGGRLESKRNVASSPNGMTWTRNNKCAPGNGRK